MKAAVRAIVGIGASAGGLEALKALFQSLPTDSGAAFVVIQHLDPKHESLTAEILTRSTTMPTVQVSDGMVIEPNHVYVIPPNAYLTLQGHTLQLGEPVLQHGLRMPIDTFLWSLAEQHEERAIAIIVSGTGSDGALGLRAVKGSGGLVLAQSPDSAQYDGMPRSAIATGLVDFTCPVEAMSVHLARYLRHPYVAQATTAESTEKPKDDGGELSAILALLQTRTGHDFRAYKQGTLRRRISRRMGLHHLETMAEYLAFLRGQEDEATLLFKDLLIGVTAFFRDSEAFEALDKQVIAPLVEKKHTDEPIRVWVPGCASGEEAYSIAMLFIDTLAAANKHCPLQVFATDIDEAALSIGRAGVYPENVAASITPARLQRFFSKEDHSYRVSKSLRETVTFAAQNLNSDPPFSNLDLISCRNLLIYLKSDVQHRALALFHFAMRDDGYLFLGHSETVSQQDELFKPLEKQSRLYRRSGVTRTPSIDFPVGSSATRAVAEHLPGRVHPSEQARLSEAAQRYLLQEYAPGAVLVNRNHQVLYFNGPTTPYLEQPGGAPTHDLLSLARPELRAKLRVALRQAAEENHRVTVDDAYVMRDDVRMRVEISLKPLTIPRISEHLILVTFVDNPEAVAVDDSKTVTAGEDASLAQQLEYELVSTRGELQTNIEEQESANEELQAANEEVMSVNEELQSTNEELETSKEELQSMNEELTTVVNQLKEKVDELSRTNDDLANLLSSTDIATLFLDAEFRIGRFTPATKRLLNLIDTDVGRPLSDIRQKFTGGDLLTDARQVLERLTPLESEVTTENGDCYLCRILPYRTSDNRIAGVAITFVDITERQTAEQQARRLASMVRDSNDAITLQNLDGNIIAWNQGAERMYGWSEQQALAMNIRNTVPEAKQNSAKELIRRIADGELVQPFEMQRLTKDGAVLDVSLTGTPVIDHAGRCVAIATTERDITDRKRFEKELRESEQNFRALVESAPDALVIVNATGEVRVANSQAERLFGYNKEELLGMAVEALIPQRFRDRHAVDRQTFATDPRIREMGSGLELFALGKDGSEIPIEVRLSPITTNQGPVVSAAIRDISERKRADEVVLSAKALAESAYATKSRFLATASHDLRQPLQSLNLLNAALLKISNDPKAQKMLTMQGESLTGMGSLLNSLLDISKLESGTVTAVMKDIALHPIFTRLRSEFGAEASDMGLELNIEATADVARSDADLLYRLLQNLVANAIRYTERGLVKVDCTHAKDRLRICVSDSGKGIPQDQLTHIFDEFHQLDRDPQQRHGGLGLGLSIVQRIADLLGSRVVVESKVGRGSTFSITLAASDPKQPSAVEREDEAGGAQSAGDGGVIFVIDDDPAVLEATEMRLSLEQGFELSTAASPPQAYALLAERTPDLIITDFHLDHADNGVDIIRTVRQRSGLKIPAILVTGDTSAATVEVDIEDVHLMTKPLDADKLIVLARRLLTVPAEETSAE